MEYESDIEKTPRLSFCCVAEPSMHRESVQPKQIGCAFDSWIIRRIPKKLIELNIFFYYC
jgi:hypothetical protein